MNKSNHGNIKAQEADTTLNPLTLNPNIQPIYSDQIIQVALETNGVKLILGYRVNNQVIQNGVVVLPINVLFGLQDTLKNFFSNKDMQKLMLESAENSIQELKVRFEQM